MRHYNRIIGAITALWLILTVVFTFAFYSGGNLEDSKGYRVDINRINALVSEGINIGSIDMKQFTYVSRLEELKLPCSTKELTDFFSGSGLYGKTDFTVQPVFDGINPEDGTSGLISAQERAENSRVTGYLRFTYSLAAGNSFLTRKIIYADLCLLLMYLSVIALLLYIRHSILKPFIEMVELPYELSRGHLKTELKENKNRFFGKFLWGLNLLRENLEQHKRRELQLEKEKRTLILTISHDIKTPLSTIKLYSKAIYDNLYAAEQKKAAAARHIEEKADQIERFVGEIIEATTRDILDIEVNSGEFYLSSLIAQLQKTYTDKLQLIKTDFIIPDFDDVILKGDLERLVEVLENIIENAMKYGDGKYIEISFSNEDFCKLITVTNSGKPISTTEFIHMFEGFWRGANAHDKQGSGLGLYICKKIMEKMDGDIFASSNGDTMSITVVVRCC